MRLSSLYAIVFIALIALVVFAGDSKAGGHAVRNVAPPCGHFTPPAQPVFFPVFIPQKSVNYGQFITTGSVERTVTERRGIFGRVRFRQDSVRFR